MLFFARRGSCDATDRQLGGRCGKSVPAIQRGLRELEAKGWIERRAGARLDVPLAEVETDRRPRTEVGR